MSLDINTHKGQLRKLCQYYVADKLAAHRNMTFIHCQDASTVDGFLCKDNADIVAAVEIKCRKEGYKQFMQWGSFMISERKFDDIATAAKQLDVPFLIAVGMGFSEHSAKCDRVGYFEVFNAAKLKPMLEQKTVITARSVNGGKKWDSVIYFDMGVMKFIE
jgi:hypothetical protein